MQQHLRKYRRWQDYQANLFGKLLLHDGLVNCFGLNSSALNDIVLTENLKAELPGTDLYFSISNCSSLVVCAIGNVPLGVDVAQFKPDVLRASGYAFDTPRDSTGANHAELWTMAEAILKASGEGLRHSMSEITIHASKRQASFRSQTWFLSPLSLREGYRGYLATEERAVVVTEFQPPWMVASPAHFENEGLEREPVSGM